MKIEAPLRKEIEVDYLVEAGADLFYCGVLSKNKINNRHNSILHQFPNFKELEAATEKIHNYNKKIFLTLNSQKSNLEDCLLHVYDAISIGIDGFIVADMNLIKSIEALDPDVSIYLSVLAGAFNAESVKFYQARNVTGFCMPRNITIYNMDAIIKNLPKMEVTAFVSGNCPHTQAFCQLHNRETKIPIYMNEGGYGELFCEGWEYSSELLLHKLNAINWCCICSLPRLKKAGITNLKIEGRSLDTAHKIKKINYINNALNQIDILSTEDYINYCKNLFAKEYGYKCKTIDCYYRY